MTAVYVSGALSLAVVVGWLLLVRHLSRHRPALFVVRVIDLRTGATVEMWPARRRGKALARLGQLTRQRNPWRYRVVLHRAGERP
jgi:hypothetical protein